MRRFLVLFVAIAVAVAGAPGAGAAPRASGAAGSASSGAGGAGTTWLIVKPRDGEAFTAAGTVGEARRVRDLYGTDAVSVEVPAAEADAVRARLEASGTVEYVEVDHPVRAALVPDDELWSHPSQRGLREARFPRAWDISTGAGHAVIAILDSGVGFGTTNSVPSQVAGRVLAGRSFVPGVSSWADDEAGSHGTASATIAAGRGNDGAAFAGACWACRILPVKVLDANGGGLTSWLAEGVRWAADQGADVISMSLSSPGHNQTLDAAVRYARNRGTLLVAAAGNREPTESGTTPHYPAALPEVIGVGGTSNGSSVDFQSNRGSWVDVAAWFVNLAQNALGQTMAFGGTSSATPLVAGAAGLAVSADASITVPELERRIRAHARPLTGVRYGHIDAARIVDGAGPALSITTAGGSLAGVETIAVRAVDKLSALAAPPVLRAGGTTLALTAAGGGVWFAAYDTRSIPYGSVSFTAQAGDTLGNTTVASRRVPIINRPPVSGFVDVPRNSYFAEAVDFLAVTGVTTGVGGSDRYEPHSAISRAQMAVFLWRMAGEPRGSGARFADVPAGAYYDEATRWLRQVGLTTGVGGSDRFDPGGVVTRDQMVTFLHRFAGTPTPPGVHPFVDVDGRSFAQQAASWAYHHGITTGVGGTNRFGPKDAVTRGQMAAFIYRYARNRAAYGRGAVQLGV